MDRLLLFGMDDDVKDAIITYHKSCRSTDRHLLQLISLSKDSQYVSYHCTIFQYTFFVRF